MIILDLRVRSYSQPLEGDYGETSESKSLPIYYEPEAGAERQASFGGRERALLVMIIREILGLSYSQPYRSTMGRHQRSKGCQSTMNKR
jgi:hypothetical protein